METEEQLRELRDKVFAHEVILKEALIVLMFNIDDKTYNEIWEMIGKEPDGFRQSGLGPMSLDERDWEINRKLEMWSYIRDFAEDMKRNRAPCKDRGTP